MLITLALPFKILSVCGIWQPMHWQDRKFFAKLYMIYSLGVTVSVYACVILQSVLLFVNKVDVSFLADILFTLLCAISVAVKSMNFFVRRDKVISLVNMLLKSWCLPRSAAEIEMEKKSEEFIRDFTIYFNALGQGALYLLMSMPFLQNPEERELPYRVWLPYDLSNEYNYWITFIVIGGLAIVGITLNITVDVIVSGFVIQGCVQLDILRYRLNELPKFVKRAKEKGVENSQAAMLVEQRLLRQAILHYDFIIKFTKVVTETFDMMIVEQFAAGALIISVIIYTLMIGEVPFLQKLMSVVYLVGMTGELYAYCYFGNEITIKSFELSNDIYNMDWLVLSNKAKKMLIFIMMRTNRPIIMSYGNLIILNIDSFKSIMKVSYTAFNVLKDSS